MNLPNISSTRMPTGHYVRVSTSNGRWKTTTKAAMADCSVSWNETLTIHGCPLTFPPCLMPIFSRKSKAIHLELCASYESGHTELVGVFETTFGQVLVNYAQSGKLSPLAMSSFPKSSSKVSCLAVDEQRMSLKLKAQRIKTTQPVAHAMSGTAEV